MKKRFTEEQIVRILREVQSGEKVIDTCRKHGISDVTYYNWKAKYAGMQESDIRKLKELELENTRLKRIVADQALENLAQKEIIKNFCRPK